MSTRIFDAPREAVFAAWQDPVRLARWWGPLGFSNTFDLFEFRPGGVWRFTMHGPDGKNYPNVSVFSDIKRPERIVFRHDCPPYFQMNVLFEDAGGGARMTWRMLFDDAATCEKLRALCVPANEQNFDRLAAELRRGGG